MLLKTPTRLIYTTSFLLLALGVLIFTGFKLSLERPLYPMQTKDNVCTEACIEALMEDKNSPLLKDCPVEDKKDGQQSVAKQANLETEEEILILVWIWPYHTPFPVDNCESLYNIKNCRITDDRSQYEQADAVLFHVRDISDQIPNLQKMPRFPLQMWVWVSSEPPSYTPQLRGAEDLFNLTSNYRRDSDIWAPYGRVVKATEEEKAFQIPKKDKLVCWIVSHWSDDFKRSIYFKEFSKHIQVEGFGKYFGREVNREDFFKIIASCKFYLSFENSIHKDYISEKIFQPLALGTVPVVIGPPRDNYEEFIPRDAFIHIDDFSTPKDLAEHLKAVDQNQEINCTGSEMLLKTPTRLIYTTSFLLLALGVLIFTGFKLSLERPLYPLQTKDNVCTEACIEALMEDKNSPLLKDCPVEDKKDGQQSVAKQANLETEAEILILVWIWPFGEVFQVDTCESLYNIKNCRITDDRSQYEQADAVLFHVRDISDQIPKLLKMPRFPLQMWVWMDNEPPSYTPQLRGAEDLFNLTSNYRRDSDIWAPYGRVMKATEEEKAFQIPKKDKLVCWIVSHWSDDFKRSIYFKEFSKHIQVEGFGKYFGREVNREDFFKIIASCKFYLSFENSIHKDYISEKIFQPLVLGTVPVVIGPPRDNYEEFIPRDAFIHIDDFSTPKDLAEHLKAVDQNQEMYEGYFAWRKHFVAKGGHPEEHACRTCEYIRMYNNYRVLKNINKWYFN
ncbi:hypothetical protein SRHO_G00102790 [Serrasalmus rhombeus]